MFWQNRRAACVLNLSWHTVPLLSSPLRSLTTVMSNSPSSPVFNTVPLSSCLMSVAFLNSQSDVEDSYENICNLSNGLVLIEVQSSTLYSERSQPWSTMPPSAIKKKSYSYAINPLINVLGGGHHPNQQCQIRSVLINPMSVSKYGV